MRKPNPLTIRYKGEKLKLRIDKIDLTEAMRVKNWIERVIYFLDDKPTITHVTWSKPRARRQGKGK